MVEGAKKQPEVFRLFLPRVSTPIAPSLRDASPAPNSTPVVPTVMIQHIQHIAEALRAEQIYAKKPQPTEPDVIAK